jgi:hypothetical protein
MLMLASEAGNLQVVHQLLSIGFSVNEKINGKSAADLACENNQQNVLLTLLKSDSKYPSNFNRTTASESLKKYTEDILKFFNSIEEDNSENILNFLQKNPSLRHIYNLQNISAAAKAIDLKKFKIYEILLKNNVFMSPDEEIEEITQNYYDDDELRRLREIHQKSSKEDPEKHIKILTAMSKTGPDELKVEERVKIIEEAYKALDKVEGVQPLLKAVAECRGATIFFDFNRVWVNFMDPSLSFGTNGAFYPTGRVYIAAKDLLDPNKRNEALGVIAHEFCHFAINLAFKNLAKPYEKNDQERERYFNEICGDYRRKLNNERIVSDVFDCYRPIFHHAEMIVRAPQLMVIYRDNPEALERCNEEYSRLFANYTDVVLPRIESSTSSVENFLIEQLKKKVESYEEEIKIKNDKLDDMEVEIVNERCKSQYGRLGGEG